MPQNLGAGASQQRFGAAVAVNDFSGLFVRQERRLFKTFKQFAIFVFRLAHGLLRPPAFRVFCDFAQRAIHHREQPQQPVLEHVVGGAAFQCLDGRVLANGAGDENKGDCGVPFPRQRQRIPPVETGHGVIKQDEI